MRPTKCFDDAPRLAIGLIEVIVPAVGVGLQYAAPIGEMAFGMLAGAIARGVEQRRRRAGSAKGPIVANIDPDSAGFRSALGENGNRRVVAMQPFGGENMGFDERVQRPQRRRAPRTICLASGKCTSDSSLSTWA
jgi:hypothetical protein